MSNSNLYFHLEMLDKLLRDGEKNNFICEYDRAAVKSVKEALTEVKQLLTEIKLITAINKLDGIERIGFDIDINNWLQKYFPEL
jgi:hypothetical protein